MPKMVSKAQNSWKSLRKEEPRHETSFGRRQAVPVIDALYPASAQHAKPNAGRARLKKWTNALAKSVAGQSVPPATEPGEGLRDRHIIEWRRP